MFPSLLNNPRQPGLIANIAMLAVVTVALNAFLFSVGWAGSTAEAQRGIPVLPPDYVIGLVWVALLALMGAARWLYVRESGDAGWRSWMPFTLAAACLAYPFYTGGLQMGPAAFWGTIHILATVFVAIGVMRVRGPRSPWLLVPTACWGGFVVSAMLAYPR
ncbi:MAG: tryptophan-rich sensory protein [Sphingomonas sp.]|nr:tryptophan-rich sensory protein [Sphingomonas sp.]